jgi:hypothetical protein
LHSSEVPLVLNLQTGSITPQYHVVFDDHFSTVTSVERETDPPEHWADLCLENSTYIPTDVDDEGSSALFLNDDWLTPDERAFKTRALTRQETIRTTYDDSTTTAAPTTGRLPTTVSSSLPASPVRASAVARVVETRPAPRTQREPAVSTTIQREPATPAAAQPQREPSPPPSVRIPVVPPSPSIPSVVPEGVRRSARINKGVNPRYIDVAYLNVLHVSDDPDAHQAQLAYLAEMFTCQDSGILNIDDPRVYAAKLRGNDADNPTFQQAMNGPNANEYIKAMHLEIHTLVAQNTWESVPRPSKKHNVLKGTWAFKLKRLPDGTAYRFNRGHSLKNSSQVLKNEDGNRAPSIRVCF